MLPEQVGARRRRRVPNTAERFERMLFIAPYLIEHEGTTLQDASKIFGIPEDQMRQDLDLLFMSGLPPYGPGDLVDVEIDEDDRITIRMADHLARPLKLSRHEALALYRRGVELLGTPGVQDADALEAALNKLRASLGPQGLEVDDEAIQSATAGGVPDQLDAVMAAADSFQRLRVQYFAASTNEWSDRIIEPEKVFAAEGNWYVATWDVDKNAERLLRVDRIRSATQVGETFEPRGLAGAERPLYTAGPDDHLVTLRLAPHARWIAEYYLIDAEEEVDGYLDVTFRASELSLIKGLVLRVAPDAQVLAPAELAEMVREAVTATRSLY